MSEGREPVRSVVILGGGTAGWMTAAALSRFLTDGKRSFTLVESDDIGPIGVGEATIPPIVEFNQRLGIDEGEFIRATGATFKLAIEFVDWYRRGDRYFHPFGNIGHDFGGVDFHQIWSALRHRPGMGDYTDYSITAAACRTSGFQPPHSDRRSPLSQIAYAYHFDAGRYAAFLRQRAEQQGVTRIEGRVESVDRDAATGAVTALRLADGRVVEGDLFIDCSGFAGLLIGKTLGVAYHDWSHWLPCDRAVAMPSERLDDLPPYTRATAEQAGWRWRIPLQHRTGNGHVYSSAHVDADAAEALLREKVGDAATGDARHIRFVPGVRERMWDKNVVSIGLSGGFIEPLESTSIHLIQTGIAKLLWLFPDHRPTQVEQDLYNRLMREQFDYIRDFIILHYTATRRDDGDFWKYVRTMPLPDSLAHKIALFRDKGRLMRYDHDLFGIASWAAVMIGQHIMPEGDAPLVGGLDGDRLETALREMRGGYAGLAAKMPRHADFLARKGLVAT